MDDLPSPILTAKMLLAQPAASGFAIGGAIARRHIKIPRGLSVLIVVGPFCIVAGFVSSATPH